MAHYTGECSHDSPAVFSYRDEGGNRRLQAIRRSRIVELELYEQTVGEFRVVVVAQGARSSAFQIGRTFTDSDTAEHFF
jgi:hypothetical protein